MKVSSEKLNKLDCWEYEDLKSLKKKKQKYWRVCWWIAFTMLLVSSISLFIYVLYPLENDFKYLSIVYFLIVYVIFVNLIEGEFDAFYSRIFNYFFRRTETNKKIESYESYFSPIEKEIEEEAISILNEIEMETRNRLSENKKINDYLLPKRKRELYLYEIEKAAKNHQLNQNTLSIFEENIGYIKIDLEKRRGFETLSQELKYERIKWLNTHSSTQNIVNRLTTKKRNYSNKFERTKQTIQNQSHTNRKEKADTATSPLGINTAPIEPEIKNYSPDNKSNTGETLVKTNKQNSAVKKPEEKKIIELPESSIAQVHPELNQLEFDFENPNITVKSPTDIPTKRNIVRYEPIIKASPEFYQKLAIKKIEIGMKGELLVMEHERRRLIEEGENPDIKLRHKSLESDSFGYDILSFENGKEIYIEVKTTTGSFWSNLFFTQNEYSKLKEYGEQYYLYRICYFDLEANKGDLFIFSGEKMINSHFDFKSKVYVLTQK